MTDKEAIEIVGGMIDSMAKIQVDIMKIIHDAAWNQAIEAAAMEVEQHNLEIKMINANDLRKLKK